MTRTYLAILAAIAMSISLAGCEGGGGAQADDPPDVGVQRDPPAKKRKAPGPGGDDSGSTLAPSEAPENAPGTTGTGGG